MSVVNSQNETAFGRSNILIPDVRFENLRGHSPTYKILDLFRRFALANELINPPDRHTGIPKFEYEFVVPEDSSRGLAVVNGVRTVKSEPEIAEARYNSSTNRFSHSSSSRGYKVAAESHRLAEAPEEPGSFVARISLGYGQYEGGYSMGGSIVPNDAPAVIHDGEHIISADRNAEQRCREVFDAFHEILGAN